jgi:deferrochelatase/peroxidase EfeB
MKMKLSSCSQILGNTFDPARVKLAYTSSQRGILFSFFLFFFFNFEQTPSSLPEQNARKPPKRVTKIRTYTKHKKEGITNARRQS